MHCEKAITTIVLRIIYLRPQQRRLFNAICNMTYSMKPFYHRGNDSAMDFVSLKQKFAANYKHQRKKQFLS